MTTPYDGTEDVLNKYSPGGCNTEDDVIKGIDEIEKRDRNKYCNDTEMARITNDGISIMA
jgi:ribosomal protein S8